MSKYNELLTDLELDMLWQETMNAVARGDVEQVRAINAMLSANYELMQKLKGDTNVQ